MLGNTNASVGVGGGTAVEEGQVIQATNSTGTDLKSGDIAWVEKSLDIKTWRIAPSDYHVSAVLWTKDSSAFITEDSYLFTGNPTSGYTYASISSNNTTVLLGVHSNESHSAMFWMASYSTNINCLYDSSIYKSYTTDKEFRYCGDGYFIVKTDDQYGLKLVRFDLDSGTFEDVTTFEKTGANIQTTVLYNAYFKMGDTIYNSSADSYDTENAYKINSDNTIEAIEFTHLPYESKRTDYVYDIRTVSDDTCYFQWKDANVFCCLKKTSNGIEIKNRIYMPYNQSTVEAWTSTVCDFTSGKTYTLKSFNSDDSIEEVTYDIPQEILDNMNGSLIGNLYIAPNQKYKGIASGNNSPYYDVIYSDVPSYNLVNNPSTNANIVKAKRDIAKATDGSVLVMSPVLAEVASTGSYNDLKDKPNIDASNFVTVDGEDDQTITGYKTFKDGLYIGNQSQYYAFINEGGFIDFIDNTDASNAIGGSIHADKTGGLTLSGANGYDVNLEIFDGKPIPADSNSNQIATTSWVNSNASMVPSSNFTDLTLGASGLSYTAPANGWFTFDKHSNATEQYATLFNETTGIGAQTVIYSVTTVLLTVPVKKGDIVRLNYNLGGQLLWFRFVYAQNAS